MKIKLDENVSRHLKSPLDDRGHDVATAAGEGLLHKPDVEVAARAASEERVLFTLDLEFGDLRKFPPGTHPGIVLFRPRSFGPGAVSRMVLDFVDHVEPTDLARCVIVVEPTRIRVRRPPSDA